MEPIKSSANLLDKLLPSYMIGNMGSHPYGLNFSITWPLPRSFRLLWRSCSGYSSSM